MSLAVPWLVFPLVLGLLSLGCGLLVQLASGTRLPSGLLLPTGFALVVAAALFPPMFGGIAWLATPLVLLLATAGIVLSLVLGRRGPIALWPAVTAVAAYAAYAAPTVLSGRATFDGYVKLDDTATYLAMLDRFMGHGYDTAGLAPSTYEATLNTSLALGYPMGSVVPVGVGHALLGTDAAWLWQPYLSVLAALLALALYALVSPVVLSRPGRAVVAVVASQAALLYGYALWGGVKELAAALLLALLAGLLPTLFGERSVRAAAAPAIVVAAFVGVLSVAGAVWLAPLGLVALLAAWRAGGLRFTLRSAAVGVAAAAAFAAPAISAGRHWLSHTGAFTGSSELANLGHPLRKEQIAGIWPVGDFRSTPGHLTLVHVLVALVVVVGVAGVVLAVRRRAWGLLAYVAGSLGGAAIFVESASPWIGGKSLATASPALLAAGLAALWAGAERSRRLLPIAAVAGVAIAGGVLWSNVLAYHDVLLAPNARLGELETIGKRFAGQGPALMTEYEVYGVRHFLRSLNPEGASELRRSQDTLTTGRLLETGDSADVDEFPLATLEPYRTLVLRRSPAASRPPSIFKPVWHGRYYTVWQQVPGAAAAVVEHVALGDRFHPATVPSCSTVLAVAHAAGPGGSVATVARPPDQVASLANAASFAYGSYGERTDALYLTGSRSWSETIVAERAGLYDIGVDGTVEGQMDVTVDGRKVSSARSLLNWPSQYQPLALVQLAAGTHTVGLDYRGSTWRPGTGGIAAFGTGPFVAGLDPLPYDVTTVAASDARSLCGQSLDWLEAIRAA